MTQSSATIDRLARRVPRRTVLLLDLTEPPREPGDPIAALTARGRPTVRQVTETLERAATDHRVAGLAATIRQPAVGFADLQELRDAVLAFRRSSGKPTVAHAETFGEFAAGNAAYYLATAFDQICLQPSGDVGLVGLASEVNFLRGALDKLGVTPQLDHRHEYKNAKNLFTETEFTPAHREAAGRVVGSLFEQLVAGVAEGRGTDDAAVRALVDRAPLLGPEAVEAGLVDRLAYRDEALELAKERAGEGAQLLGLTEYRTRSEPRRRPHRPRTIAVINGLGAITQGKSRVSPLAGPSMGADTITLAFRQARADSDVRAVLFRVDSPGGSYVASDAVWREVVRTREAGTPVVVSMGNVAGSGGYFVAMAADRIVAQPGTITGSIGVVGGKAVLAGLKGKLGVTTDAVAEGANALVASTSREYTPEEWDRLQVWLDRAYDDFTAKVAQGRQLPLDRVREIAKGRIWTGADALELGLVDAVGGYPVALGLVRELLGMATGAPLQEKTFPPRRTVVARALGRSTDDPEEGGGAAALAGVLDLWPPTGALTMPDLPHIRW